MRSFFALGGNHAISRKFSLLLPALAVSAVGSSALLPPAQAIARVPARALECRASVSDAHPSDYSTVTVYVATVPNARVSTSAHYKTTTHPESARANHSGEASTSYDISDATTDYRVIVTVNVRRGSRSGSCHTSYVPE